MPKKEQERINLGRINYLLLIIVTVLLIVGYLIMSFNEITLSPIILGIVYVVLIPLALLWKPRQK
ncbi:MAG TPA: hypothetical protein PKI59_04645 [Candidatus Cloacimonadota bacterium]|nr:hypothetical protein [Candidatus Cloacimonadota bacterium]